MGSETRSEVDAAARRARTAARTLATLPRAAKDAALLAMADGLVAATGEILSANAVDLADGREAGLTEALLDRLTLDSRRIADMADGLRHLAGLPDSIGEVVRGYTVPNGLRIEQIRVPLGVVGVVYEARPNVTVDTAGLCLKSGNAALLRGSASAAQSNIALVAALGAALERAGLPADAVVLVPATDRSTVTDLLQARGLVDVVIPRGGAGLIRHVVENSTVPVIETGVGNCHVYVDSDADLDLAEAIVVNSKTRRPSVCNAAETLLVHSGVAEGFVPRAVAALRGAGVTVHADERSRKILEAAGPADDEASAQVPVVPAEDADWDTEYLSLDIALGVVDSLDGAIEHIGRHGTGHTEAIVTGGLTAAREFTTRVDAAAIMVNASTAFTDGAEFGFGAEIGISTQKLHARGPMGLPELTSTTYVVTGTGQIRPGS